MKPHTLTAAAAVALLAGCGGSGAATAAHSLQANPSASADMMQAAKQLGPCLHVKGGTAILDKVVAGEKLHVADKVRVAAHFTHKGALRATWQCVAAIPGSTPAPDRMRALEGCGLKSAAREGVKRGALATDLLGLVNCVAKHP